MHGGKTRKKKKLSEREPGSARARNKNEAGAGRPRNEQDGPGGMQKPLGKSHSRKKYRALKRGGRRKKRRGEEGVSRKG